MGAPVEAGPVCAAFDGLVPAAGGFEGDVEASSLPTGAVPGAGCAAGALEGEDLDGSVEEDAWGVDCAHTVVVSAKANPASATVVEPLNPALMTSPPTRRRYSGAAPLRFTV